MAESEGVAIARLQEQIRGVRDDMTELVAEQQRTRARLHNLEGIAQAFADIQKANREKERVQYQQLATRLTKVGLLLAFCAVLSPIVVAIISTR